jgi:predicted HTH transcriptional regulator
VTQVSRNPILAQILLQAGYIERLGSGIDTVLDTLEQQGHPPPNIDNFESLFSFGVFGKQLTAPAQDTNHRLNADISERQRILLNEIIRRGSCTIADLAPLVEAAKRTVQRDLLMLEEYGLVRSIGATHKRRYEPAEPVVN